LFALKNKRKIPYIFFFSRQSKP